MAAYTTGTPYQAFSSWLVERSSRAAGFSHHPAALRGYMDAKGLLEAIQGYMAGIDLLEAKTPRTPSSSPRASPQAGPGPKPKSCITPRRAKRGPSKAPETAPETPEEPEMAALRAALLDSVWRCGQAEVQTAAQKSLTLGCQALLETEFAQNSQGQIEFGAFRHGVRLVVQIGKEQASDVELARFWKGMKDPGAGTRGDEGFTPQELAILLTRQRPGSPQSPQKAPARGLSALERDPGVKGGHRNMVLCHLCQGRRSNLLLHP